MDAPTTGMPRPRCCCNSQPVTALPAGVCNRCQLGRHIECERPTTVNHIHCCVCINTGAPATPATTIVRGYASCTEHSTLLDAYDLGHAIHEARQRKRGTW